MGALKIGRGTEEDVKVGPLIDQPSREKVAELVQDALDKGATCVVGGEIPDGRGYFYPPTVLGGVPDDARVLHEEIFGPVAPVTTSSPRRTRSHEPTTPSTAWSPTCSPATSACDPRLRGARDGHGRPEPGNGVQRRRPFGGVKQSGIGREGGKEGMEESSRRSTWP